MICKQCGGIFQVSDFKTNLCDECLEEQAETFELVQEYLRSHPKANMIELVSQTGVSLKAIRQLMADGRLSLR